jgi:hypothetical protein
LEVQGSTVIAYNEKTAVISDCKKYRYLLRRSWDHIKPRFLIVMLNPSTADDEKDDATIRSCTRLCSALGAGSYEVVNLFAFRATNPKELYMEYVEDLDIIGPKNDISIEAALMRCDLPLIGWGAHALAEERGKTVTSMIRHYRPAVFCLGANKDKSPKHPLYIKSDVSLQVYA